MRNRRHLQRTHLSTSKDGADAVIKGKVNATAEQAQQVAHLSMSMDGGGRVGNPPGGAFLGGRGALPSAPKPPPKRRGFL